LLLPCKYICCLFISTVGHSRDAKQLQWSQWKAKKLRLASQ
jgi:hypothetical protein